ncbi:Uncharacterised protein [Mycobacteroides abscessus subsp. massiliense]|nr:Uncharacterised protein [Mycobacteroides abscessus subsp. massiliense]
MQPRGIGDRRQIEWFDGHVIAHLTPGRLRFSDSVIDELAHRERFALHRNRSVLEFGQVK